MTTPDRRYRFEGYRLDTQLRELRDSTGALVPLTAKAFDTLCVLIARRDGVVAKDTLMAEVWAGRVVEDNTLTQAIAALRRAFGGNAQDHRFIVTVPGRGYRFVAALQPDPPAAAAQGAMTWRRLALVGGVLSGLALIAVAGWRERTAPPPATPTAATVAVLPFSPGSGPRDPLLELGMADALGGRLARSPGLRVRALSSVQRVAGSDALEAGRRLGAEYVVDGVALRRGGGVQIQARLRAVRDGRQAWTGRYQARLEQLPAVQDAMASAMAAALSAPPRPDPGEVRGPCDGGDLDATRALLQAQYQLHRRASGTVGDFHAAIRRDPTCARAYAGLAAAYLFLAHNDVPPSDTFPLAGAAAAQALRLDPRSAEAHMARGRYLQLYAWDWAGAERELRQAIALNPSLADAHFGLAHVLTVTGRFDEALDQAAQARALDPLAPLIGALGAGFLTAARRPGPAQAELRKTLELEPDFWIALLVRGGMALDRGDAPAAVADLERAAARSRRTSQVLAVLAAAYVEAGQRGQAEALLRELQARRADGYVPATSLAAVHLALGQRAAALDELERAHAEHDIRIGFLKVDARWNGLRGAPRFPALARRLGLSGGTAYGRF